MSSPSPLSSFTPEQRRALQAHLQAPAGQPWCPTLWDLVSPLAVRACQAGQTFRAFRAQLLRDLQAEGGRG
jgi:hypothetical protein